VGVNAEKTALKINVKLPMFAGKTVAEYSDDEKINPTLKSTKWQLWRSNPYYSTRRWYYLGKTRGFNSGCWIA
jgi:hypothetical protein